VIELLLQAERALSVGLLDRAETLYRQVAAADPRNSIAVVGLARVAIERGDELEALELGRRALEIDPENSAAQRLVQRLEEVRAYRGEPPVSVAAPPAPEPVRATAPRPEPMPAPGPAPEPEPAPAPETSPVPGPVEAPPRARSWLDRVLRRNR
jgi:tetratricopeptide (TPR) repeat protein